MKTQIKGSIFILISSLMYGAYGLLSRGLESYDVIFQTYVRCFAVALVLLAIGLIRKDFKKIERVDLKWFVVVCCFTVFSIAPIVYAFKFLTLGTASFLFYGSLTIFTYIFGFTFFKEKFTRVKVIVLILSALGLALVFWENFGVASLLPALMALLNGVASSGEVTFSKKISDKYSSVQISLIVFGIIGLTHIALSLILGEHQDFTILTDHLPNLLAFVAAAVIGFIAVIEGYKYVEPSIGAIVGLMEIVFSLLFGVIFFKEAVGVTSIVGGILIIAAAGLPSVVELGRKKFTKSLQREL